ncbi:MAG: restriction endonuclease subunit S [Bacteroidetes bacterium]|nr:restriction endonuclease subunit S [Bacteroidota bacterium]
MKWEKLKVADVCELAYGKSLTADSRIPGDYPVYGSAGEVGTHTNYLIDGPGIIIGRKGSVGTVYYEKRNFFPIDTSYYVIPKDGYDLRFLYYKFQTLGLNKLNSDAAVPGLNRNVAYDQSSIYPPLPTQRKIASILSAYDDLIENNLKRIKLLEEKAQLHYKIEFGEYQFGDREPQNLPKGWSIKSIGDIYGKLESGSRPKGGIDKELKEGIASVGAENVIGLGKYNYQSEKLITEAFFENMNRGKIENKDILIYKDGAYIGKTTLFQDDFPHEKCCVNEHVFLLRSKDELYQNYLFFTLYQKLYFDKMQQLNANAAQPGINQESLKSLRILWPSKNVIEEFNKKVESLMKLIFVVAKQNTKLREARDILLPRLMSGQIEV